ncbi:MAG: NAD(P)-binding domain-containing protein, partial [Chloroflexi bacterium]|nr:NAD(P)-binding domain-containing protein [Chloroflexota bacterium]
MENKYRYAVIGAGNGGKAMAAYLALLGAQVTLYNRTANRVEIIRLRGGIDLENPSEPNGFGRLHKVTDNMEEALNEADIIMVVVPSTAHADIAKAAAQYLRDDHIVVLNPGRTGGALEFRFTLEQEHCPTKPIIAEAETFLFASR